MGKYLETVPLLSHLTKQEREKLGGALKLEDFDPASTVFNEGEPGDVFYIIKEGVASVQIGGMHLSRYLVAVWNLFG